MAPPALALAPDEAAEVHASSVHARVVEVLRELTATSEHGVLVAGQSLTNVVGAGRELADVSMQAVDALRQTHEREVPPRLESIGGALEDYVEAVRASLAQEATVLAKIRTELQTIEQAARALDEIGRTSRMLAVSAAVETAQLRSRSARGRFESTVTEMRKLATLVDDLHKTLGGRAADLRAEVRAIEKSSAELTAELTTMVSLVGRQTGKVGSAGERLVRRLSALDASAQSTTTLLVDASLAGLTALQFQDPMIQEIQRLDALVGYLTDPEAVTVETVPLSYAVNLGDRASTLEDDDDDDDALDAGDLLLF